MSQDALLQVFQARLDAHEEALRSLAASVADIVQYLRSGGLSPHDVRELVRRLRAHDEVLQKIAANKGLAGNSEEKGTEPMAIPADLQAVLTQIDTDTTAVATTVKSLDALISTAMTTADVATVKTTLAAVATRLEAIAADPLVPVPPTPPPPPVTPHP